MVMVSQFTSLLVGIANVAIFHMVTTPGVQTLFYTKIQQYVLLIGYAYWHEVLPQFQMLSPILTGQLMFLS